MVVALLCIHKGIVHTFMWMLVSLFPGPLSQVPGNKANVDMCLCSVSECVCVCVCVCVRTCVRTCVCVCVLALLSFATLHYLHVPTQVFFHYCTRVYKCMV